ncbi:MAG: universal stress protein [Acidobacteria bacterium]|nr:universal stress protein [Acidobacteriota bacterium]
MSTGPFSHVVACVDESPATEAVVRLALQVRADGGRLSVVHVMGGPPFSESFLAAIGTAFGGSPLGDNAVAHREIAQGLLEVVCEDIPGAEPVLLDPHDADSAPDAVVRWADDNDVDAIVAASHGDPLARMAKFVGSFSGYLARHASCPVILMPPGTASDGD